MHRSYTRLGLWSAGICWQAWIIYFQILDSLYNIAVVPEVPDACITKILWRGRFQPMAGQLSLERGIAVAFKSWNIISSFY